jgi:hypothetical protein
VKILYVTGWCRSGSTLLGNLLNEVPGVVHVGEVHYLWQNGVLGAGTNTACGCGEPLAGCPLWSSVPTGDARAAIAGQQRYLRTRHTHRRLAEARGARPVDPGARAAVERMLSLYRAVTEATGARLVVDSSKFPAEAAALSGRPDVRVLHLVRDPRATARSWRRAKAYIPAMSTPRSGAYWTGFNAASDAIGRAFPDRYLRLRYEDFAGDPATALRRTLDLAGLDDAAPIDGSGTAELGVNHTVTGNPDRLTRGTVRVTPDDAWRDDLPRLDRATAMLLAAPLLRRYGYR